MEALKKLHFNSSFIYMSSPLTVGPSDLSLHGPAAAEAGTSVTVTCSTAPSVPATQVQ